MIGYVFVLVVLFLRAGVVAFYQGQNSFALPYAKAAIGQEAQLRCSKVIAKSLYSSICSPFSSYRNEAAHCFYRWSKGSDRIDPNDIRISITASRTDGYCPISDTTAQFIKDNVYPLLPKLDTLYFTCYTSVLTILSVTESDFGRYSCNFSYHDGQMRYKYRYGNPFAISNITLIKEDVNPPQPQSQVLVYNQGGDFRSSDDSFGQCMVYGADDITWYVEFSYSKQPLNVSAMRDMDMWQVFNATIRQHQPYDNVVESFIVLNATSPFESYRLGCFLTKSGRSLYNNDAIIKIVAEEYYSYIDYTVITSTSCALVAIFIMFIAAIIVASVRSNTCGT